MSEPSTTYRGHTIRWSDNSDEWVCFDLSDKVHSSPKLSAIKAAIDRLYLAERKNNAVQCYELNGGNHGRTESNVVEYLGKTTKRSWSTHSDEIDHKVAVVAQRSGSERPSRRETELDRLMPVTPDAERAWEHYATLRAAAAEAERIANEAFKSIPRMQPFDIQALIDLYERDKETNNE